MPDVPPAPPAPPAVNAVAPLPPVPPVAANEDSDDDADGNAADNDSDNDSDNDNDATINVSGDKVVKVRVWRDKNGCRHVTRLQSSSRLRGPRRDRARPR